MTLLLRHNDIATSLWRNNQLIITPCVYWELILHDHITWQISRGYKLICYWKNKIRNKISFTWIDLVLWCSITSVINSACTEMNNFLYWRQTQSLFLHVNMKRISCKNIKFTRSKTGLLLKWYYFHTFPYIQLTKIIHGRQIPNVCYVLLIYIPFFLYRALKKDTF